MRNTHLQEVIRELDRQLDKPVTLTLSGLIRRFTTTGVVGELTTDTVLLTARPGGNIRVALSEIISVD